MKIIQFGAENGSSEAGRLIRPYKKVLNSIFYSDSDSDSDRVFVGLDGMSIIFRLSGKNKNFGSEGPEYLQKSSRNFLTIDLTIPESKWKLTNSENFFEYLIIGIQKCIEILISESVEKGYIKNRDIFENQIEQGLEEFREKMKK